MGAREFDYYIFIDYSESLIGYCIIEKDKVKGLLPRISKFSHYNSLRHKLSYIQAIKKVIEKSDVLSYFLKVKIRKMIETPGIYSDIVDFLSKHDNCLIFVSIDNKQLRNFLKLVKMTDGRNIKVVRESELKKGTKEYRMSLVLDTLLNIERLKNIG